LSENRVAFLLETEQDCFGQRARLPERDEIRATLTLEFRQHAARVKPGEKTIGWFVSGMAVTQTIVAQASRLRVRAASRRQMMFDEEK
jgi:hypothetical protein